MQKCLPLVLALLLPSCSGSAADGAVARIGLPPAAAAFSPELTRRLARALQDKGPDYEPRTHHLREDGSPSYSNRLLLESSPYLQQHAHNPVNWYPWGDEAFEAARRLGRPVLLSIEYSTCHWCHVMEEESFEDVEIAAYMNANYVAIKVDREERPDIDAIYMSAVQMLAGRGGWPMTTWLTAERKPFFGGTYFPARDGDRGSRKGFLTLLRDLKRAHDENPDQVVARAAEISARIQNRLVPTPGEVMPTATSIESAVSGYRAAFDAQEGGQRGAPKFPSSLPVRLLLRYHRRTGDESALNMATLTLSKMAAGGMYDHVGGGFHRYSTDARWLVPHFEKMLYDNALLTLDYLEGFQATGRQDFAELAREILHYVSREMTSPGGGFFSATDADSIGPDGEREEGWFFTWTPQEIRAVLGPDAAAFEKYYNVTAKGNFEGRSILHVTRSLQEVATQLGLGAAELELKLVRGREKLYGVRSERPQPLRDDKILTSWNGLMISAFARGAFVLHDADLTRRAESAASFVSKHLISEGRLQRSFKDGKARHNAYLDDYAFFIAGLLDLYETTANIRWLEEALQLQKVLDRHYQDASGGGYFMTSDDHESLLAREKPSYDGAEPSGNSVALMNLVRLYELTTDERYRESALRAFRGFGTVLTRSPRALAQMLLALEFHLGPPKEIVIVSADDRRGAEPFLEVLRRGYEPNIVLAVVTEGKQLKSHARFVPLVQSKVARKGKTTAYVCEQGVCQLPASDVETFEKQLARRAPR